MCDFLSQQQADDADAEAYYAEQEWIAEQQEQARQRIMDADAELAWFEDRGWIDFFESAPVHTP